MYDVYPWNQPADASDKATGAVRAVQVALDRRDNGGEPSNHAGPVTATGLPLPGARSK